MLTLLCALAFSSENCLLSNKYHNVDGQRKLFYKKPHISYTFYRDFCRPNDSKTRINTIQFNTFMSGLFELQMSEMFDKATLALHCKAKIHVNYLTISC